MNTKACSKGTKRIGNKCVRSTKKKISLSIEERSYVIDAVQTISNIDGSDRTKLLNKLGLKSFIG